MVEGKAKRQAALAVKDFAVHVFGCIGRSEEGENPLPKDMNNKGNESEVVIGEGQVATGDEIEKINSEGAAELDEVHPLVQHNHPCESVYPN